MINLKVKLLEIVLNNYVTNYNKMALKYLNSEMYNETEIYFYKYF